MRLPGVMSAPAREKGRQRSYQWGMNSTDPSPGGGAGAGAEIGGAGAAGAAAGAGAGAECVVVVGGLAGGAGGVVGRARPAAWGESRSARRRAGSARAGDRRATPANRTTGFDGATAGRPMSGASRSAGGGRSSAGTA